MPFGRREVLWILNYLLTPDAILNNVHFVENVGKPIRIRVVADGLGKAVMLFIKHKNLQIQTNFHEIRMNWRKALYLECVFQRLGKRASIYLF